MPETCDLLACVVAHPSNLDCSEPGGAPYVGSDCDAEMNALMVCQLGICGNFDVGPTEACDDGNNVSGDGCSAELVTLSSMGLSRSQRQSRWASYPGHRCPRK